MRRGRQGEVDMRNRQDEVDGPRGQRDSLKNYYGGQPPEANRKVGSPWDTSGRDDSRRSSDDTMRSGDTDEGEDEGILTDEELSLAMKAARSASRGRTDEDEDEQEEEDEEESRTDESEDDDGDGDAQPKMRVRCPGCGTRFQVAPPDGITLAETEDEDEEEDEGGMRTMRAQCAGCSEKFEVAPPRGYKFEDEDEDAKDIADTTGEARGRHMSEKGRRRAAEALVSQFFRRYRDKRVRESLSRRRPGRSSGSPALDAFRESYRDAMKLRRRSAMP